MARRVRRSRADNQRWNQMTAALRLMNFAFNNIRLYPPTHSEVVGVLTKLLETLTPILEEQEDLGFGFMDELLYIEGAMSIEETANNQMLVDRFSKCRVKYLTIMKGLTMADLLIFFQILNAEATKPSSDHPAELLDQKGVRTMHIVEAEVDDLASKNKLTRKKTLLDWYEKAVGVLGLVRDEFQGGKQPDLKPLFRLVDDMTATIRSKGYEPFLLLPLLGQGLDPHLAHSVNVAVLSCALGDAHGLNSGQINTVTIMAMLHDLGRLTIPVEWTQDHTPLSLAERKIARDHADWGYLLLTRNEDVSPQVGLLAAYHHDCPPPVEGGYHPDVYHRILALADDYDLSRFSERFYWKKQRRDRMLASLVNARGDRHEAALVKLLVNCVGFYPVGSLVRLDDGRPGIVVRPNPSNPGRPKLFMYEEAPPPPPPEEAGDPEKTAPPQESAALLAAAVDQEAPVIWDLGALAEGGLGYAHGVAAVTTPAPGQDLRSILDRKKEYLLSFAL